jgi:hypothetical protein
MTPLEAYIRAAAQRRGINPDIAVTVARHEGGLADPFRHGEGPAPRSQAPGLGATENSFGPFQLYVSGTGAGLGDRALAAGIDPRKDWQHGVDFALDEVKRKGWGQWYGARAAGITGMEGVGSGGSDTLAGGSGGRPAASILHPEIDPTSTDTLSSPVFGSMSGGVSSTPSSGMGIDPIAADLAGMKEPKSFGDRLGAAGAAFDKAANEYPAPRISGAFSGDARQTGGVLLKMLQNPSALAQALLRQRMA